ncbi:MAG: Aminotransferase class [Pedosphaera sp.]|nr:Aminotransferase class [Pedosphaera sp.]
MTLAELLTNEELRQHEFPVTRDKIFLAHASVCPLPRRVVEAVTQYAAKATAGDQERAADPALLENGRQLAARLLNSRPEEVAFVGPTSLALSLIAGGLRWRKNDNILIYFDDYPSNVYPWMALAEKGVQVRLINTRELGVIRPVDVMGQVDEQTRMVALASCHFITGTRLDYQAIGKFLHDRNILFCLDGIQTVGAFPTTVEQVDFLAADAHKWLLGPCAAGIMYVRKELQERVQPLVYGWNNVRSPNYVAQEQIVFRQNAQRFEAGSHNLLGIVGLSAAMELLLELGVENIAAELLRKRSWLAPALQAKGYLVAGANAPAGLASGIVTISRPDTDLPVLHQKLEAANIITSLRADRKGQRYIRISPHFYNTDAELQRLVELL